MKTYKKLFIFFTAYILVGFMLKLVVFSPSNVPTYATSPEDGNDLPNWYEIHTIRGVVDSTDHGMAQGTSSEELLQIIQERRRDGLNSQVCLGCHREPDTCYNCHNGVPPGPWLYNNQNYSETWWNFKYEYTTSVEQEKEIKGKKIPHVPGFRSSS